MKKMTIGIFAPSSPAHILFESKYKYAKSRLLELGFNVKEGNLIQNKNFQGYRTASGKERANELMNLILDEDIDILMPVIGGINDKYAGNYRDQQVMISGAQHLPPAPFLLKEKINEFIEWYSTKIQELHPVERAAMVQIIFVGIHPFVDGNGRTSRLLLNLELMKNGYPPIVIKNANRLEYYAALDKAHTTGENFDLISLVMKETNDMLDCYISLCNNNF